MYILLNSHLIIAAFKLFTKNHVNFLYKIPLYNLDKFIYNLPCDYFVKFSEVLTMNMDFPRILTLLRKEKGITQKQAALDLNVAQALLSHYEKGKRECGLDFLVRAADYYNVSTDYLLGRSAVSSGEILSEKDIPDGGAKSRDDSKNGDIVSALNKKLIMNSVEIIFRLLDMIKCRQLTKNISSMLMMSVYKAFRITYATNDKNDRNIFSVPVDVAPYLSTSALNIDEGLAMQAAKHSAQDAPQITTGVIEEFDKQGTALLSLIKNTESRLKRLEE